MHVWLVVGIVALAAGVGLASFVPIPQVLGCNVSVNVGLLEVSAVFTTYFSVTSVGGQTNGGSTLINWGGLDFAPPALSASFTLSATVAGHTGTRTGHQYFPSVPIINGGQLTASDVVNVGNIPDNTQQGISVALMQNGQTVATGSGSMGVSC